MNGNSSRLSSSLNITGTIIAKGLLKEELLIFPLVGTPTLVSARQRSHRTLLEAEGGELAVIGFDLMQ